MNRGRIEISRLKILIVMGICFFIAAIIITNRQKQEVTAPVKSREVKKALSRPEAGLSKIEDLPGNEGGAKKTVKESGVKKIAKPKEAFLPDKAQKNPPLKGALPEEENIKSGSSEQGQGDNNLKIHPNAAEIEKLKRKNLIIF